MRKKLLICIFAVATFGTTLFGQDGNVSLKFDARADYNYKKIKNTEDKAGFHGRNLNLMLDGKINSMFEYHLRQRLNVPIGNIEGLLDATDWAYLTYHINDNFSLSAGKQVVAIGGFEYDYAPIDGYFLSAFCNNIPCYEVGLSLGFKDNSGKHSLQFQISNSPFITTAFDNMYSYNFLWNGNFDFFKTLYSVNMIEYKKGDFINYIALGNRFDIGNLSLELDYTNRYHGNQDNFFDDFSVVAQLKYSINNSWNLFIKGGYDQNKAQEAGVPEHLRWDVCVVPGTEYTFGGAGFEFFPLKNKKDIRIHGYVASSDAEPTEFTFNLGLTWKMQVLNK